MLLPYFKSLLEQDDTPIVICDLHSIIVYMNPSAKRHYHQDLTGKNVKDCHPPKANQKIDEVLAWFSKSKENNCVYTYRNDKANKDVYMIALRNEQGDLIGYYEKHAFRDRESKNLYDMP